MARSGDKMARGVPGRGKDGDGLHAQAVLSNSHCIESGAGGQPHPGLQRRDLRQDRQAGPSGKRYRSSDSACISML
ncbi:hypothetical protein LMG29542_03036 [Paraburkholderia humisilvae]|uniref:Uncharacterized protein n=1 Tax=Paraburkholderia humisilvae TaxID=627669 RepID=A0A6J5DW32_9BURK|nr:hypothetical protein LMG29542_03036 [Paraburkholderia humisilvae]